jgi:hypothetical protein
MGRVLSFPGGQPLTPAPAPASAPALQAASGEQRDLLQLIANWGLSLAGCPQLCGAPAPASPSNHE